MHVGPCPTHPPLPPLQSNRPSKEKGAGNKGSSSSTATFNLIKNILGAGVLSLPSGVGAFSKNPYVRTGARIPHVIDTPNHELNQLIHAKKITSGAHPRRRADDGPGLALGVLLHAHRAGVRA